MGLTKKQRVFIEEYLQCWNATEAALRAGYSKRSAGQIASRLLKKDNIAEEIEKRISEKAMSADEVLIRLAEHARVKVDDVITIYGSGKNDWYLDLPKAQREGKTHLIKSIIPTQHGLRVELVDKQRALELLGKHHKLFTERHELMGKDGNELAIRFVWKDAVNDN